MDTNLHLKNKDKGRKFFYGNEDRIEMSNKRKAPKGPDDKKKRDDARTLENIEDITILELQRSKEAGRGIDRIDRQMNKYVAEALVRSFHNKVKYEIKVDVSIKDH